MDESSFPLEREPNGYFSGVISSARAGSLYRFKLDHDDYLYPDPESRFQPEGPHGPSQVIDPASFPWTDGQWKGIERKGQIVYELHIGSFTPEGTWNSAREQLAELASIGITIIEIMPIAEFNGRWGWGYDGVDLFAPTHLYGSPNDAKCFIDEAHRHHLGVILDVVYNHFGPDGNYIKAFADEYFTDQYQNDWGESINFSSEPVREFYLTNARYWIEEFHFDGLRLDSPQDIHDTGEEHIVAAIAQRVRKAAGARTVYVVAENEPQNSWRALPQESAADGRARYGMDAFWNNDFHHSAIVALTGRTEGYYADHRGSPQEFVSAAKYGYLYQGQRSKWQNERRGSPSPNLGPWNFVTYLQNHDQIANSSRGERPNVSSDAALYRAMSALLMLGPSTPMLFQGQEFGATSPFLYFCDHGVDLCEMVHAGRSRYLAQFPSLALPEMQKEFGSPGDPAVFERCKLDFAERGKNARIYNLYKDLIQLRREDPVLRNPRFRGVDGSVLSDKAFLLRYFNAAHGDRLLLVNLGPDLHLDPAPDPLLAPPLDRRWSVCWSSEDARYGGTGTFPPESDGNWRIAGHSALLLVPEEIPGEMEG